MTGRMQDQLDLYVEAVTEAARELYGASRISEVGIEVEGEEDSSLGGTGGGIGAATTTTLLLCFEFDHPVPSEVFSDAYDLYMEQGGEGLLPVPGDEVTKAVLVIEAIYTEMI